MTKKKHIEWIKNASAILVMIALSSCAAMSQKHKHAETYFEDLSQVRPSFKKQVDPATTTTQPPAKLPDGEVKFMYDITKSLNQKLDSISSNNRKYVSAQGYRILVYTGSSSEEALKIKQQVYSYSSDLNVYSQYKQPSFRVKIGDFADRIEASYVLNELKEHFPNAMIVPDQINLAK